MAEGPAPGNFFDGTSNQRHPVELELRQSLIISEHGRVIATWAFGSIRRADGPPGFLRLSCVDAPVLARLEIADPALAAHVAAACPALDDGQGGQGQTLRVVGWSMAAIASIILSVIFIVPYIADVATPLIPRSFDRFLGRIAEPQIRLIFQGPICTDALGQAALEKLVAQLQKAGGFEGAIQASVIATPIPNAVALPGGRIFIFEALIARAKSIDEVAGVIAHELGHVHHRDQVRAMINDGGSAFLIGLLFGDIAGGGAAIVAARSLLQAGYSREVETAADDFAQRAMLALGRSPHPLGEFLARLSGDEKPGATSIFDSHPLGSERQKRLSEGDITPAGPPLLSDGEWQALVSICRNNGKES